MNFDNHEQWLDRMEVEVFKKKPEGATVDPTEGSPVADEEHVRQVDISENVIEQQDEKHARSNPVEDEERVHQDDVSENVVGSTS